MTTHTVRYSSLKPGVLELAQLPPHNVCHSERTAKVRMLHRSLVSSGGSLGSATKVDTLLPSIFSEGFISQAFHTTPWRKSILTMVDQLRLDRALLDFKFSGAEGGCLKSVVQHRVLVSVGLQVGPGLGWRCLPKGCGAGGTPALFLALFYP